MLRKIQGLDLTYDVGINLLRRSCDWCDDTAMWSVSSLPPRLTPWTELACNRHREQWFPFEGVSLTRRCAQYGCTSRDVSAYVTGNASPMGPREQFHACPGHRSALSGVNRRGGFIAYANDYREALRGA